MIEDGLTLGIDTSNYTTSVCAIDRGGEIIWEGRRLLQVKPGDHGMMQSMALFQHITHLPPMLHEMRCAIGDRVICKVGVSTRPRQQAGSYMPVFHAGFLCASSVAATASTSLIETTHQSGHIAAGVATAEPRIQDHSSFLVIHLSGGTTDVLLARQEDHDYAVQPLFSSIDLHAGQFIDRVGVMIGLPFPAGPHLEALASTCEEQDLPSIPSALRSGNPSFAGPWSAAQRLWKAGVEPNVIAAAALRTIAITVEKMIRAAFDKTDARAVLLVGGVASNQLLRSRLEHRLGPKFRQLAFCHPHYASDNAYGVALIAGRADLKFTCQKSDMIH